MTRAPAHIALTSAEPGAGTVIVFLPVASITPPPSDLSNKSLRCYVETVGGRAWGVREDVSDVMDLIEAATPSTGA